MLGEVLYRNFLIWSDGRSLPAILAERTDISERTWRSHSESLRQCTSQRARKKSEAWIRKELVKSGLPEVEQDNWIAAHPKHSLSSAYYSTLVYESQVPGITDCPLTLDWARKVDVLGTGLREKFDGDDLEGFKEVLLESPVFSSLCIPLANDGSDAEQSSLLPDRIRIATSWEAIHPLFIYVEAKCLWSFLTKWDVEFGALTYFRNLEPRPCFELVLPKLDPAVGSELSKPKKRRGALRYPARRLIDLVACIGLNSHSRAVRSKVPTVREISLATGIDENTLVSWRDGTTKLTTSRFSALWDRVTSTGCGMHVAYAKPWPLFVAATIFQHTLCSARAGPGSKSITLVADEYMQWWQRHFSELTANGRTFGTTRWPSYFDEF